ncbi:hypothetical protein [Thalassoroseus pseudoceratinae]|uniref:hypothetical protein n=1 Tax=Thalassoroseus pseudoceratinae TaxID=2713176 RepID=UPI00142451A4|nr:hypothetical protein [Thalassoroseus pseudoceratinae]
MGTCRKKARGKSLFLRAAAAAGLSWCLLTPGSAKAQFAPSAGPNAYPPTVSDPSAGLYDPSGYANPGMAGGDQFASDPYAAGQVGLGSEMQGMGGPQGPAPGPSANVFAGSNAGMYSVGASVSSGDKIWSDLRDFQVGGYHIEDQTLVVGGGTLALTYDERYSIAGRSLLGGAINDHLDDSFHYTGDLFAGYRAELTMEHWFKAGVLYDYQEEFSRVGPQFGALLYANGQHPISVDVAVSYGNGDPITTGLSGQLGEVAGVSDEDIQTRVGTFITPNIQIGGTAVWSFWDSETFEDYDGFGGFLTFTHNFCQLTLDVTASDDEVSGFANFALTTDAFVRARTRDRGTGIVPMVHPRDWLTRPVIRDITVRTQSVPTNIP